VADLNATAKATLRDAGVSQAEWRRYHGYDGRSWGDDACGCPDDRCISYHHYGPDDCGCLPVLLDRLLAERAAANLRYFLTEPGQPEREVTRAGYEDAAGPHASRLPMSFTRGDVSGRAEHAPRSPQGADRA
jgi:hypothetical protein